MSKRLQCAIATSVTLLVLLSGCEPIDRVEYVLEDEQGMAALQLGDHVEIRFSAQSVGDERANGELQVGGPGGDRGTIQVGDFAVDHQYEYNHLVFTVGETTIELTQTGTQLVIGDQQFDLSQYSADNRLILWIDEAGNVSQEPVQ